MRLRREICCDIWPQSPRSHSLLHRIQKTSSKIPERKNGWNGSWRLDPQDNHDRGNLWSNTGMQYLIENPCHVKLPSQEDDLGGIAGLEAIENPFKVLNIIEFSEVKEIGSISSHQARKKICKSSLSYNPKLLSTDPNTPPDPSETTLTPYEPTVRTADKHQLVDTVLTFKEYDLPI